MIVPDRSFTEAQYCESIDIHTEVASIGRHCKVRDSTDTTVNERFNQSRMLDPVATTSNRCREVDTLDRTMAHPTSTKTHVAAS